MQHNARNYKSDRMGEIKVTVKQLINDFEFSDFYIGIYINNVLVMMGRIDEINNIASGYVLNAMVLKYNVNMHGELTIFIKL